jgi:CheY-like chemotaxis protein
MQGRILVCSNDAMLVTTRGLILEKAGYKVLTAQTFANALLMLKHHQIDLCVLCQSLTDEEQRGIVETARAVQPEIKLATLDFGEPAIEGVELIQGLMGPSMLLNTVGKILTQKDSSQTDALN